jgi:multiple sugar transport system substrate-binding protein
MKKKLISILLAAAMVAALATGCGNKTAASASKSSDSGKETLKVWLPPLDDNTEKNWGGLLKDWEKKNNCTVKLTIIPWDKYEKPT